MSLISKQLRLQKSLCQAKKESRNSLLQIQYFNLGLGKKVKKCISQNVIVPFNSRMLAKEQTHIPSEGFKK